MIYTIYPIPYEIRGSEYLALLYKYIREMPNEDGASFRIRRFSWGELLARPSSNERRVVHIHWETNIYGSKYLAVSFMRMAYRFPGLWVLKVLGVKVAWTVHNLQAHDYPHPRTDALGRWLMWRLADIVIVQQRGFWIEERAARPSARIVLIPHPNFIDVFGPRWHGDRNELRRQYGISEKTKVLLAFGSVRPYKELPKLIDAITEARSRGADVTLLIAGKASDEYHKYIVHKAEGNPGVILRLGFVNKEDVPEIIGLADYSILYYGDSSLNSGPLLMSLSYGVPVITRDMPAAEVIETGKNGFVFHDAEELCSILCSLRDVPNFDISAIIGSSGPDWPTVATEHQKAYKRLWQARN